MSFENLRSLQSSGGAQLQSDIVVASRYASSARIAYAIELLDDHGRNVQAPEKPPAAKVESRSAIRLTRKIQTGLPDGFYELHVRALGIADNNGDSTAAEDRMYFQIASNSMIPLDADEWSALSQSNVGVAL